jgi:serine protease Do
MFNFPKEQPVDIERAILQKLKFWIVGVAFISLIAGIGLGALFSGRPTVAQNEVQIARAPEALSASFAKIARKVEPAVVNINTVAVNQVAEKMEDLESEDEDKDNKKKEGKEQEGEDESSKNPLFEMFRAPNRSKIPDRGVGSGFIVDPKGFILTNQHVVEGATRIIVRLQSGEELRGEVVGMDEETDLAVVKVNADRDLPTVKLGDSSSVEVGDWVLAIGSPFGLDQTVTAGIISTKERQTRASASFQQFLQTDAAINRGNSGGPLVNMHGEVIGINSQIATTNGDYNGIGFALPANEASFVYQQIVSKGKVQRGYLGINLDRVKREFARVYGLPEAKGVLVTDIRDEQGPAAKAGIQPNDIIVEFNDQPLSTPVDLISRVALTPVGQSAKLTYLRDVNGKLERKTTVVTVGERPSPTTLLSRISHTPPVEKKSAIQEQLKIGLTLSELTPQLASSKRLVGVRGLLVTDVDLGSIADDAGLEQDNVILKINRVPVTTLADFERVVSGLKRGDAVVMNIAYFDRNRISYRVVQFTYQ